MTDPHLYDWYRNECFLHKLRTESELSSPPPCGLRSTAKRFVTSVILASTTALFPAPSASRHVASFHSVSNQFRVFRVFRGARFFAPLCLVPAIALVRVNQSPVALPKKTHSAHHEQAQNPQKDTLRISKRHTTTRKRHTIRPKDTLFFYSGGGAA